MTSSIPCVLPNAGLVYPKHAIAEARIEWIELSTELTNKDFTQDYKICFHRVDRETASRWRNTTRIRVFKKKKRERFKSYKIQRIQQEINFTSPHCRVQAANPPLDLGAEPQRSERSPSRWGTEMVTAIIVTWTIDYRLLPYLSVRVKLDKETQRHRRGDELEMQLGTIDPNVYLTVHRFIMTGQSRRIMGLYTCIAEINISTVEEKPVCRSDGKRYDGNLGMRCSGKHVVPTVDGPFSCRSNGLVLLHGRYKHKYITDV